VPHLDIRMNVLHDFGRVQEIFWVEKRGQEIGQRFLLQVRVDGVADILDELVNEFEQLDGDQLWKEAKLS